VFVLEGVGLCALGGGGRRCVLKGVMAIWRWDFGKRRGGGAVVERDVAARACFWGRLDLTWARDLG